MESIENIQSEIIPSFESQNEIRREKTLAEIIKSKKELIKLSKKDIRTKEASYSLTSKNKFYNNNFIINLQS